MFPLVSFDLIDDALANEKLVAWGHWLGGCERPFGRQSFGLFVEQELLAVAVSASTVNETCAGFGRQECVELARLCAAPSTVSSPGRAPAMESRRAEGMGPRLLAGARSGLVPECDPPHRRHLPARWLAAREARARREDGP